MYGQKRLEAFCQTDRGRKRSRNEDACFIAPEDGFFLVADGIGGLFAGDVASSLFAETVTRIITSSPPAGAEEARETVLLCFREANRAIREHCKQTASAQSMGCTAELLIITGDTYTIGHIGDSRTYLLHPDKSLLRLTEDHTFIQQQIDLGLLSHEEAATSRMKNVILRAVGVEEESEPDIITGRILPGMTFLLCTDGLFNMVRDRDLLPVLEYDAPLSFRADMLISMANDAGGQDNITVSLVRCC